jgi:hypothetical protein
MTFFSVLTLILVVAKLLGYFHHSWLLVFAPVLFTTAIGLALVLGSLVIASISVYLETK